MAVLAVSMLGAGAGCKRLTLQEGGVYQGDKLLYNAERATVGAYKSFDAFLRWEEQYRAVLPVEVSRAADNVRKNARSWIDTAGAFRDAYVANPTGDNRDLLKLSLDLIDTALAESAKYMTAYRANAPNAGLPELPEPQR